MTLSRPLFSLLGSYLEQLYNNPIRTKSLSSCVIATLGNITSQYISDGKSINHDSVIAYGLFGLLFGGTVPHFFYTGLDQVIPENVLLRLLAERLLYTPLYLGLALYMLSRFEGKPHRQALGQLLQLYWPVLKTNWQWLTIIQYLNLRLVPPMLRVLVINLVGFFWTVFMAKKRNALSQQKKGTKKE